MANTTPLLPGPWLPLTASESESFLERLTGSLTRTRDEPPFTKRLPITDLRAMPLSFYPGWLLVEGEAQVDRKRIGTFDVLYGQGFMWVIDGTMEVIHNLNSGHIPLVNDQEPAKSNAAPPAFLKSPLTGLNTSSTGADYLRFFCGCTWGDKGPFTIVETPTAPILQGIRAPDDAWRKQIRPVVMTRTEKSLIGEALVSYNGVLSRTTFAIKDDGEVVMEDDNPLENLTLPNMEHASPFRNLRPAPPKTAPQKEDR